jgi:hypothetical protein
MQFEWDDAKNASNQAKHGVAFEDAAIVFEGRTMTWLDERYRFTEPRLLTFGELAGRVVVIAHTVRGDRTRIISMRKANARETARYRERLAED